LPILEKKPGALRHGAPFVTWDLPVPIKVVRDRILKQDKGDRAFVELLLMARDTSAPLFFAKAEMGSNPISAAKNDVASLPSAACVRPATAQNTKHRLPPCFVF